MVRFAEVRAEDRPGADEEPSGSLRAWRKTPIAKLKQPTKPVHKNNHDKFDL